VSVTLLFPRSAGRRPGDCRSSPPRRWRCS